MNAEFKAKWVEALRELRVFNEYDFAQGNVYIQYCPRITGRISSSAKWQVRKRGEETDSKAAWYNHGNKTFCVYGRAEKQPQLLAAIQWASEKYGILQWAKTPFGSYMSDSFVEVRLNELSSTPPTART